jgi:RNA polymerase sigma-70 factor, ECF subfamily
VWCVRSAGRYVDGTAVEDVAHEALVRAWRNRARCQRPQDPWPWLAQIVRNEALRYIGRDRPASDGREPEAACEDRRLDEVLDRLSLEALIRPLPDADRALVQLHYELDLSVVALADVLGISESAVKVRLHRARQRLRSVLQP